MDPNKALNMTMLCDFYELTMGNGYLEHGMQDRITYFDVFFRSVPDDGGYAIAAGLEQIIDYIENLASPTRTLLSAQPEAVQRGISGLSENFRFTGDIWAVPEGTPVFRASRSSRCARPPSRRSSGNVSAAADQPPEPDRHEGQPHLPRGTGPHGARVRSRRAQGADGAIPGARAASHRRLRRHRLHDLGRGYTACTPRH